jgi:hypothetical protein
MIILGLIQAQVVYNTLGQEGLGGHEDGFKMELSDDQLDDLATYIKGSSQKIPLCVRDWISENGLEIKTNEAFRQLSKEKKGLVVSRALKYRIGFLVDYFCRIDVSSDECRDVIATLQDAELRMISRLSEID